MSNALAQTIILSILPYSTGIFCLSLQGSHRLEKYLNLEGILEKSLKIKSAFKSTGKLSKSLEKYLNSTIFCRTKHCRELNQYKIVVPIYKGTTIFY